MSKQFAEDKGYNDALMLDYRGYVAEGTGANIFFIKDNEIHTPYTRLFFKWHNKTNCYQLVKEKGFNLIENIFFQVKLNIMMRLF